MFPCDMRRCTVHRSSSTWLGPGRGLRFPFPRNSHGNGPWSPGGTRGAWRGGLRRGGGRHRARAGAKEGDGASQRRQWARRCSWRARTACPAGAAAGRRRVWQIRTPVSFPPFPRLWSARDRRCSLPASPQIQAHEAPPRPASPASRGPAEWREGRAGSGEQPRLSSVGSHGIG